MPSPQPTWVVVGEPGLVLLVAPDQNLEGKINAHRLRGLHQRSAGFGIAEDEHFSWPQLQAGLGRGVIDARDDGHAEGRDGRYGAVHRVLVPVSARNHRQAVDRHVLFSGLYVL